MQKRETQSLPGSDDIKRSDVREVPTSESGGRPLSGTPIEGMKVMPMGMPLMAGAWFSLLGFTLSEADAVAAFKKDTGMDIEAVLRARGISAMIDKSTGYDRAVVAAFADWVTTHLWGEICNEPESVIPPEGYAFVLCGRVQKDDLFYIRTLKEWERVPTVAIGDAISTAIVVRRIKP
jgi:hypothetical protein